MIKNLFINTKRAKIQRLTFLRDSFLRDVPEEKFRYDRYVSQYKKKDKCGTICCIVGWLPMIFPSVFKWLQLGTQIIVKMHRMPSDGFRGQIRRFFGINKNVYGYLFEGMALTNSDGLQLLPAVRNMRTVSKATAVKRMNRAIELIEAGII